MPDAALLTIGLPVRNGEAYLARALDALRAQTFEDFVIIIGDNLSTDRTREIALDYAARDRRLRYHRHPIDLGAPENFTWLVHQAGTPYFRWHAADDLLLPACTARCLEALAADPRAVLAYAKTALIDAEGRPVGEYEDRLHTVAPSARERFFHVHHSLRLCNALYGVIRTDVARRTQLLLPFVASDVAFLHELSLYGSFLEIPDRLFLRRIHPGNTASMTEAQLRRFAAPARWERPTLRTWRFLSALRRGVWRAPLPVRERALLELDLLTTASSRHFRPKLVREAGELARFLTRRMLHPSRLRQTSA